MYVTEHFERFNSKKTEIYNLSIRVTAGGFSFLWFDPRAKTIVGMRHYELGGNWGWEDVSQQLTNIAKEDKLIRLPYNHVVAFVDSDKYTFVPVDFFQESSLKSYLMINHPLGDTDELYYHPFKSSGMYMVYTVHTYIASQLFAVQKSIKLMHPAIPFLVRSAKDALRYDYLFTLQVYAGCFDLAFFCKGQLMFCSQHNLSGPNDLAYFVMSAIRQNNLQPAKTIISVSGINANDEAYEVALKFLPGIRIEPLPDGVLLSRKQLRVPQLPFLPLYKHIFANY